MVRSVFYLDPHIISVFTWFYIYGVFCTLFYVQYLLNCQPGSTCLGVFYMVLNWRSFYLAPNPAASVLSSWPHICTSLVFSTWLHVNGMPSPVFHKNGVLLISYLCVFSCIWLHKFDAFPTILNISGVCFDLVPYFWRAFYQYRKRNTGCQITERRRTEHQITER
jgi:hypothetical protein